MSPDQYDTRDEQEHADVAVVLTVLPAEHPARDAHARGVGTLELTHLVADRVELVDGLKQAFLAGYRRLLAGSGGFRPS